MDARKNTGSIALGKYLAARRTSASLSLRQMADLTGKAPSTIQAWEQGKRMPDLDDLFALSHVLNADVGELIMLAATPVKELEKRAAEAEARYKRLLKEASGKPDAKRNRALKEASREVAFLRNLIGARRKHEHAPGISPLLEPLYHTKRVPVLGAIAAGKPRLAVEEVSEYVTVPRDLEVDYALRVEGDSMVGAGIDPGDIVWVKQSDFAEPGQTIVALLGGEEVTIKHLVKEGGQYLLRANNPDRDYPDIPLGPRDTIIGIVQRVIKRPGPPPRRGERK